MRRILFLLLCVLVISPPGFVLDGQRTVEDLQAQEAAESPAGSASAPQSLESFLTENLEDDSKDAFDAKDIAASNAWAQGYTSEIAQWLGPLAPVALSPFFGVMCLSGLALWGPEWATDNALLGESGPLQNETLFFVLLALTLLTSLPRLTKVSKPFAQAVDRLETYAVIVILLTIKVVTSMESDGDPQVALVQMGVMSFTLDTLLGIAMVINILVINSVKFFFEFMVWLTPVPFLDAIFEVCNKTLCAVLMAIYAYSPTLATLINLSILVVAAFLFRWVSRQVRFYRTIVLDPLLSQVWPKWGRPAREELIVFPKDDYGVFKAKSRLRLTQATDGEGWNLQEANWWMPSGKHPIATSPEPVVHLGWIMNSIDVNFDDGMQSSFRFSRRYDRENLTQLCEKLGIQIASELTDGEKGNLAVEFA